jgi:xyloglucan galactosyltransferase MUR3
VFFSVTVYQMVGIGVKVFFMDICQNCTVITIETSPTFTAISGRSKKYWYAAPYPSSFHWHSGLRVMPWTAREAGHGIPTRSIFSLFLGSVRTSNMNSNLLRRALFAQCAGDEGCSWHTTAHACNGVINATASMLLFQQSVFCPAPPGDSITRKSIFDSLVSGCIPVIFAKGSINQYLWYVNASQVSTTLFPVV